MNSNRLGLGIDAGGTHTLGAGARVGRNRRER